ncbi:MAG: CapA family protein, partial [Xanthomonadales bacterium]|nr:CapA family protein [Xanthomonadales bacterium]
MTKQEGAGMHENSTDDGVMTNAVDRRTMLGRGAALFGSLLASQVLKLREAKAQASRAAAAKVQASSTFTVTVAGETMATRPFSMHTEPEFLDIVKLYRASDLAVGHLEMNFGTDEEIKWTPRGTAGVASYMLADPAVAKDLRWMGIHALSLAMNHSFD